nr:PQQ-dependent sugar dehydrogenase [Maribacter sp. Hal144]
MKKIVFLFLILTILSCGDDDISTGIIPPADSETPTKPDSEIPEEPDTEMPPTNDPTSNCEIDADTDDFSVIEPIIIDGFKMTQLLPNNSLVTPWEITIGPEGYLWVSERESYKIVRINPKTGDSDELIELNDATHFEFQTGLLRIALHPEIGQDKGNDYVYASYTYNDGVYKQKIVRMDYSIDDNCDADLSNTTSILTDLPASGDHNSGRLVFGPDNTLYYTIGDLGANQFTNKCQPVLSQIIPIQAEIDNQDWSNYPGKILRINLDGTIPNDNPVINGVKSHIYSYGHRNAQGLIFPKTEYYIPTNMARKPMTKSILSKWEKIMDGLM